MVFGAKSSLLLFIHAYMQSANIEYVKPLNPIRIEGRIEGGTAPIGGAGHTPHADTSPV